MHGGKVTSLLFCLMLVSSLDEPRTTHLFGEQDNDKQNTVMSTEIVGNNINDDWLWQSCLKDEEEEYISETPRTICPHCERPAPSTCYCPALPDRLIELHRSHCLVLQHPHELRRKNRSLPIVQHSLDPNSLTVVIGRRFGVESGNAIPDIVAKCRERNPHVHHQTWLVFPGTQATSLSTALQRLRKLEEEKETQGFVTVVFLDATWQYACEMDRNLRERNQYPSDMLRISIDLEDLPKEESFKPRRFEIRKARADDQFCTAEAISRVLAALESRSEIHAALMKPLDLMVSQWNSFRDEKS